jgi:hypothetical protein
MPFCRRGSIARSRKSAQLFLQSSELGGPLCVPPLVRGGGGHTVAGEGAVGSQFRREDRHCGTLDIQSVNFVKYNIGRVQSFLLYSTYRSHGVTQALLTYPYTWSASSMPGLRPVTSRPDLSRHYVSSSPSPVRDGLYGDASCKGRIVKGAYRPRDTLCKGKGHIAQKISFAGKN